ncbi:MAG: papain fold toxin domain-containing protein [Phormidium sp.]
MINSFKKEVNITEINAEQVLVLRSIATQYENLKCVECASAIEDYLTSQRIHGKRIKLYTGDGASWDSRIYDDSISGDAISVNGRHEAMKEL